MASSIADSIELREDDTELREGQNITQRRHRALRMIPSFANNSNIAKTASSIADSIELRGDDTELRERHRTSHKDGIEHRG
jgi:hypothetical protein